MFKNNDKIQNINLLIEEEFQNSNKFSDYEPKISKFQKVCDVKEKFNKMIIAEKNIYNNNKIEIEMMWILIEKIHIYQITFNLCFRRINEYGIYLINLCIWISLLHYKEIEKIMINFQTKFKVNDFT